MGFSGWLQQYEDMGAQHPDDGKPFVLEGLDGAVLTYRASAADKDSLLTLLEELLPKDGTRRDEKPVLHESRNHWCAGESVRVPRGWATS